MDGGTIMVLAFLALGLLVVFAGVKTVPQGFEWTIERFGKYTHTLRPGLSLIIPFIDKVGSKVSMMRFLLSVIQSTRDYSMWLMKQPIPGALR